MVCIVPFCRVRRNEARFFRVPARLSAMYSQKLFNRNDALKSFKTPSICEHHFEKQYIFENGLHFRALPTLNLPTPSMVASICKGRITRPRIDNRQRSTNKCVTKKTSPKQKQDKSSPNNSQDNCLPNNSQDNCSPNNSQDNCLPNNPQDNSSTCLGTDTETINILLSLFEKQLVKNKNLEAVNSRIKAENHKISADNKKLLKELKAEMPFS